MAQALFCQTGGELVQPGAPEGHAKRPEVAIQLCLFPSSAYTDFCGHPKGKIKRNEELKREFPSNLFSLSYQSFHLRLS